MKKRYRLATKLIQVLKENEKKIAVAESCTGGMISEAITFCPGSSEVFEYGFTTYSNTAKTELLGVSPSIFINHGAVSAECVEAMAEGALKTGKSDFAVAVSGIAGPRGGTKEKPVGLVYAGFCKKGEKPFSIKLFFKGGRYTVRNRTTIYCLNKLLSLPVKSN